MTAACGPSELVVCSLEAWDEVWRRNQFLVQGLLERDPSLRVLFVEPPFDLVHGIRHRRLPSGTGIRMVGESERLSAFRPVKPLPRVLGPWTDRALCAQVRSAARRLGFTAPVLWINDVSYAPLAVAAGWPSLYDVTDDWLLEPVPARELARRRRLDHLLLEVAEEVVVCSPALAASRGASRPVRLIPNGVDVAHFRAVRPRPADLPPAPVAVYVGTLHDERLDVELVAELARGVPALTVALIGPDALSPASRQRLDTAGVHRLGSRPYHDVPAYLQHADVIVVPHWVTPFTESLDPIKAYECLALGRPTVATPVAGFRGLDGPVRAVAADRFVATVTEQLTEVVPEPQPGGSAVVDWAARVVQFERVLQSTAKGRGPMQASRPQPEGRRATIHRVLPSLGGRRRSMAASTSVTGTDANRSGAGRSRRA